jgi:uncharacterized protein
VIELLNHTVVSAWSMLSDAAPYIWLGLLTAGLLHAFIPQEWILSQLGGRGAGSVWKAALLGIPIPLCSCGVIPATVGLRKRGAGRGAALSFLISTPETDIDSIALTWAMLGPVWAVIRPVAAVLVAVGTGLVANLLPDDTKVEPVVVEASCCSTHAAPPVKEPAKLERARRFVFKELIPDIGFWLILGLLGSGLIVTLLPPDMLATLPGGAAAQMLFALMIGIPLYICAAASTPLAAALLMKGMAPGAAVVLLLVGPATNLASALVISRHLGKSGTAIYLGGVAVGSLLAGSIVQMMAPSWKLGEIHHHGGIWPEWFCQALGVLLLATILLPRIYRKWPFRPQAASLHKADPSAAHSKIHQH